MLGNQLGLKTALAIPGDLDGQSAKVAFQGLLALAVAGIAVGIRHRLVLAVAQVLSHLGIERTLD